MSLNITKTNFTIFHSRQRYITSDMHLHIDGMLIEKVVATKFLGVILNENLTWTDHVKVVLNKTSKNFAICRKLSFILPRVVVKTLHNSLIKPYIEYCNIAWAVHRTVQIDVLYGIQKRCIRMLTNSHRKAHAAPLFKQVNLLNVYDINKLQIAYFAYESMNSLLPHCFANFFESNDTVHDYNLRNNRNIKLHKSTTNVRFFSIKCRI